MFDEEALPRPVQQPTPRVLEKLSVDELRAYITWLEEEIKRVQADISRKESANQIAAKLFK